MVLPEYVSQILPMVTAGHTGIVKMDIHTQSAVPMDKDLMCLYLSAFQIWTAYMAVQKSIHVSIKSY